MSSIPSIFSKNRFEFVVLGNTEKKVITEEKSIFSVLVLNRGSRHYRENLLKNLLSYGFNEIISVETSMDDYDLLEVSKKMPQIKFIVPKGNVSCGELINVGIEACESEFVLVIWNDVSIFEKNLHAKLAELVLAENAVCIAPSLKTFKMQNFPVKMVPTMDRWDLSIKTEMGFLEGERTLYPYEFMGIYNRSKFLTLGGFDYTITHPFWQNLDFFFRANLHGEKVLITTLLHFVYSDEIMGEVRNQNASSMRFFLKNIAPQIKNGKVGIPLSRFFQYWRKSTYGFFDALNHFKEARRWVEKNDTIFKMDFQQLIDTWNVQ